MKRLLILSVLVAAFFAATPASAQTIGTFRWRVEPFCSVLNLTVTQVGSVYTIVGYEEQCGGNPKLPVTGSIVLQNNGTIWLGLTTIFNFGNGLHTNVTLASNLSGTWRDNANQSGQFIFNPGPGPFGGGPRITPLEPDVESAAPASDSDGLKKLLAELLARQP